MEEKRGTRTCGGALSRIEIIDCKGSSAIDTHRI